MIDPDERPAGEAQPHGEAQPADDDPRRLTAALGYVFTPVVPLFALAGQQSGDPFVRRHALQGLYWAGPFLVLLIATMLGLVLLVRGNFLFICLLPLIIFVPFLPGMYWARRVYLGHDVSIPILDGIARSRT